MQQTEIVQLLKKVKSEKIMTMNDIAVKSGVIILTINRAFAGKDIRYSTLFSVLKALNLSMQIKKMA